MRATIDVAELTGIFSVRWRVSCRLEFTAIELAAIRFAKLDDRTVYERQSQTGDVSRSLKQARDQGFGWEFDFPLAALSESIRIETEILPTIKSWLDAAQSFKTGSRTIEL